MTIINTTIFVIFIIVSVVTVTIIINKQKSKSVTQIDDKNTQQTKHATPAPATITKQPYQSQISLLNAEDTEILNRIFDWSRLLKIEGIW